MEQDVGLNPLVSVICLCYNHERFVSEAIESVMTQTYNNLELIIIDDASTDKSADLIQGFQSERITHVEINVDNVGNCRAFNQGFKLSRGEYIIDLAADDILMPHRLKRGVADLIESNAGVHFGNMEVVDENGGFIRQYYRNGDHIPQGDVYEEVLARHFIGGASMMIKREVLEYLGGYDEELAYEDFDFWVRSSRIFRYQYSSEILVKKRIVTGSMSSSAFLHTR
jgi:glycosyltransferase involved in cell wall biosynthesis